MTTTDTRRRTFPWMWAGLILFFALGTLAVGVPVIIARDVASDVIAQTTERLEPLRDRAFERDQGYRLAACAQICFLWESFEGGKVDFAEHAVALPRLVVFFRIHESRSAAGPYEDFVGRAKRCLRKLSGAPEPQSLAEWQAWLAQAQAGHPPAALFLKRLDLWREDLATELGPAPDWDTVLTTAPEEVAQWGFAPPDTTGMRISDGGEEGYSVTPRVP